jgi:hypothetical protein
VTENCMLTCGGEEECLEDGWPQTELDFRKILAEVGDTDACTKIEEGDWVQNPAIYTEFEDVCYWKSKDPEEKRCSNKHYAVSRYCPCKTPAAGKQTTPAPTTQAPSPAPTSAPTPAPTKAPSTRRRRRRGSRRRRSAPTNGDTTPTTRRRRGGGRRRRRRSKSTPAPAFRPE